MMQRLMLILALATVWTGAAGAGTARPVALPRYAHVVVVIEENKAYSVIAGNPDAPYINQLAAQGVLLTDYRAVAHPSLPNYLALFSGSTQQVEDDGCHYVFSGATLYGELHAVHASFVTYAEGLPQSGDTGCGAGQYRKKHNPAAYWQPLGVPVQATRPFSAFPADFTHLPAVAFVIPDLLNDMHDGSIKMGDDWLKQHLSAYAEWVASHNSLLIVTWDEDDGTEDNHIMTLLTGAHLRPGKYAGRYDHYSLLRLLEDLHHARHTGNSAHAAALQGMWRPTRSR